jgi:histidyl-tRNA synthetase
MRDFLPEDVRRREYVIGIITRVYERYGFEPLETPAVENLETLMGKYGEEGNQLIFKILKRGEHEASGQADLALRYDLTVPLARVIAHYQARLPKLFKRYQIQPVWRADRPARGRFREFYQCDVDALGSNSPVIEAELCAAVSDVLNELGFTDFEIRLNHRQFLDSELDFAGVSQNHRSSALVALDKLDKIGRDGVAEEFAARGIERRALESILRIFDAANPQDEAENAKAARESFERMNRPPDSGVAMASFERAVKVFREDQQPVPDAAANVEAILNLAATTSAAPHMRFDPSLARGLAYYTGAIFEINVPDIPGSLGGGGRYDNLVGMFLGQHVPACGFSLGLERILVVMSERGMFPPGLATTPADVMVAVFDAKDAPHALRVAQALRASGLRVMVYPDADKIGKQIKYAVTQGIPYVAILGGDEIASGTVTVKHLTTQTQRTYDQAAAGTAILEGLTHRG